MSYLSGWKQYLVDSYHYVVGETWQLAADAKNEAYNMANEAYSTTAEVVSNIASMNETTTSQPQTPQDSQMKSIEYNTNNNNNNSEKEEINVFTVEENYMPKSDFEQNNIQKLNIKDVPSSETSI